MGTTISNSTGILAGTSTKRALLICGIVASLLYALMLALVPMFWDEYSSKTYSVSELSAINAPTRSLWFPLGTLYTLLMIAFGYGVFLSAAGSRTLQIAGISLLIYGILGIYWPPMHLRGEPTTLTDTLHIVWTATTVLLMIIGIAFGAASFNRSFKYYSIFTLVLLITFGLLTTREAPEIPKNLPTPWIGVWERINIGVFLLWVIALSVNVLRTTRSNTRILKSPPPFNN